MLIRYQTIEPLWPYSYYLLGYIYEKEKEFSKAVALYKDALRLGYRGIEPIRRLLKTFCQFKEKYGTIKVVKARYKEFKEKFISASRLGIQKNKKVKGLNKLKKKMIIIEKILEEG